MTSMIERVARAITERRKLIEAGCLGGKILVKDGAGNTVRGFKSQDEAEEYVASLLARAALAEMREPTYSMIGAAMDKCRVPSDVASRVWRAMHAAAMEEAEADVD